jgi:hypothetical protein
MKFVATKYVDLKIMRIAILDEAEIFKALCENVVTLTIYGTKMRTIVNSLIIQIKNTYDLRC